jgi:hypothetical protein
MPTSLASRPRAQRSSAVGGVDCQLRGREREDQPSPARIHGAKAEDVADERAIRVRIGAVEEDVSAGDHGSASGSRRVLRRAIRG